MSRKDYECYLRASPRYAVCDFVFSNSDVGLLRAEWPSLAPLLPPALNNDSGNATWPVAVLLASDTQIPQGDEDVRRNVALTRTLRDLDAGYFSQLKSYRNMIVDAWALARSDFHFTNPLSSCDTLVHHWRMVMGVNASRVFPTRCFEAYAETSGWLGYLRNRSLSS